MMTVQVEDISDDSSLVSEFGSDIETYSYRLDQVEALAAIQEEDNDEKSPNLLDKENDDNFFDQNSFYSQCLRDLILISEQADRRKLFGADISLQTTHEDRITVLQHIMNGHTRLLHRNGPPTIATDASVNRLDRELSLCRAEIGLLHNAARKEELLFVSPNKAILDDEESESSDASLGEEMVGCYSAGPTDTDLDSQTTATECISNISSSTPFIQNDSDGEHDIQQSFHRIVLAPRGKIGLTLEDYNGQATVTRVSPDSPVFGWIFEYDVIVAIDEVTVGGMQVKDIVDLLLERRDRQRALIIMSSHAMTASLSVREPSEVMFSMI